ncbi:DUF1501 domain-containing protein [Thermoflexibacter ruber]|uniref:Uncharacterized conserved protein, DUF1501 family n=1 Tax=Thermoflexibacter ruber TaxID=1003 RepID=A0A1I2JJ82_9BACT|nr:DUF1501 domain-containing protein [Thermoflexibacter ruber]SFF52886.1 Uncharacterized conserved protein, DUF1501 family [Thermoflexibacter ruber]
MKTSRRNFLKQSSLATVGSMLVPSFLKSWELRANSLRQNDKILVIIQLSGGNDGLNTIVPYYNDVYYQSRPSIAISKEKVLKTNDELGFNPAMQKFRELYDEGWVSVINSVGYPNPDRSHFRSMDIWQTGSASDEYLRSGWLGRYLDSTCLADVCQPFEAIEIDDTLSLALKGERVKGLALQNPQKLYQSTQNPIFERLKKANPTEDAHENVAYLYKTIAETASSAEYIYNKSKVQKITTDYPQGRLSKHIKTIAELIISGVQTSVYYVSLSGFDTHIRQNFQQDRLLEEYAGAVHAFVQDMKKHNKMNQVMIMTFSEFGRRVAQNGSNGTDHGTANNLFIINGNLKKAGFYNPAPDLTDLDEGDLKYQIDFRNIYATLIQKWLQADSKAILGKDFQMIDFV